MVKIEQPELPTKEQYAKWVLADSTLATILLDGLRKVALQLVTRKKCTDLYPFGDDFKAGAEYTALNLCGVSTKGSKTPEEGQLNAYLKTGFAGVVFNEYLISLGHDHTLIDREEYQLALVELLKEEYVALAIEAAECGL